jgi:sugar lactone lactonase YvrE
MQQAPSNPELHFRQCLSAIDSLHGRMFSSCGSHKWRGALRCLILFFFATALASPEAHAQSCSGTGTGGCQQISCPNGGTTSISGKVYAPNGTDPLPNILVYIPTATLTPLTDGVSSTNPVVDDSATLVSGSPLVQVITAADGSFTLTNVPPGANIPLVIQAGRWRREFIISTVGSCQNTALTNVTQGGASSLAGYGETSTVRFAQTQGEGDIPKTALVTGRADSLECSLRKVGIADTEFTDYTVNVSSGGSSPGRVNLFQGTGSSGVAPGTTTHTEATLVANSSASFSSSLLGSYNVLMLPCQGDSTDYTTLDGRGNVITFTGSGGRIFATHRSRYYIADDSSINGAANWIADSSVGNATATINTSFTDGNTLAQWLQNIGATTTQGQVAMTSLFNDQSGVNSPTQAWATLTNSDIAEFSFFTPVGASASSQYGRVVFNEYHVDSSNSGSGVTFPAECTGTMAKTAAMSSQEHMLEYSLFELMNFAVPVTSTNLAISVSPSPSTFTGGDAADTLSVTVTNNGSATITTSPTVTMSVTLPSGLTATSMTDPLGSWSCDVDTLTCTLLNPLAASASNSITVTVSVAANVSNSTPPVGVTISSTGFVASTNSNVALSVAAAPAGTVTAPEETTVTATNVGATTASAGTVTFALSAGTTVNSVLVVTEGYTGKDFTNAGTGTCASQTYSSASTCSVVVNFSPLYPGPRYGAVELLGSSNNVLATSYIFGIGNGAEAIFQPGTQSTVAGETGSGNFDDAAVDINGNVYIVDHNNTQILKETLSSGTYTQSTPFSGFAGPKGMAIDGAGNIYVADTGANQVFKETLLNGSYTQSSIGSGLNSPDGVVVDGSGNVYIADSSNNQVLLETLSDGTYMQSVIASGLNNPWRVAVDVAGDVYIADTGNNQVLLETLSNGTYTQSTVVTGLNSPHGLAVDGNGTIYIADTGNNRIVEEQLVNGSYVQTVLVSGLNAPRSVAVDELGNLYIADFGDNKLFKQDYSDPPSLTFASTPPNTVSSDSPQTVTLGNFGNSSLTAVSPGLTAPTDFSQVTGNASDCTASFALASTAACTLRIEFNPQSLGTKSESFVVTDNNLNSASTMQSIAVSGTAAAVSVVITPSSLPAPVYATAYNQTLSASGGTGPYTYSILSGSLPAGLTLSASGVLSGTPTASGVFNFTIGVQDSTGAGSGGPFTGSQAYSFTITAPSLAIGPSTLPAGTEGTAYNQTISASGGTSPYTYSIVSGSLPAGLTLSSSGVLSGTPTAGGAFSFTVQAQDSTAAGNGGPYTGAEAYSLTIAATSLTISPTTLPAGTARVLYSQTISASGGTSPYAYSIVTGSLPAGLTLSSSGVLSGTPTAAGTFNFSVQAQDSTPAGSGGPNTATRAYTLTIAGPTIVISPTVLPNGTVGTAYSQTVSASGGSGTYSYAVTAGSLPAGLSLNSSTGAITGTPTSAGAASFTITVTDTVTTGPAAPYTASQAFSLTVVQGTVNRTSTTTAVTSNSNPAVLQSSVTFTATVSAASGTPTGTMNFLDGSASLGSGSLSNRVATFTTSSLAVGTHSITASYSGDTNFAPSTSSALSQSIIDFAVSPVGGGSGGGGSTQSVAPGGTATYSIAITPTSGTTFSTTTYLTVTGLPAGATATLNSTGWTQQTPTSWTLPAFATLNDVSLSFHVPSSTASVTLPYGLPGKLPPVSSFAFGMFALLPLGCVMLRFSRRPAWARTALLLIASLGTLSLAGCGTSNGFFAQKKTPQGQATNYNVTVTVTTGSLSHSTNLVLTVQ